MALHNRIATTPRRRFLPADAGKGFFDTKLRISGM
jgi:hypothetical protein